MLTHRYAATIIRNFNGVVGVDDDNDARRVSGHRFVNRVVDHLVHEMMKAALIC